VTQQAVHVKDGFSGQDAADYWVSCGHQAKPNPTAKEIAVLGGLFKDMAQVLDPRSIQAMRPSERAFATLMLRYYDGLRSTDESWRSVYNKRSELNALERSGRDIAEAIREFDMNAISAMQQVAEGQVVGVSNQQYILQTWKGSSKVREGWAKARRLEQLGAKSGNEYATLYSGGEAQTPVELPKIAAATEMSPFFASLGFSLQDLAISKAISAMHYAGRAGKTAKDRDTFAKGIAEQYGVPVKRVKLIMDALPFVQDVEVKQFTVQRDVESASRMTRGERQAAEAALFKADDIEQNMRLLLTGAGFDTSTQEQKSDTSRATHTRKVR
jgi:hypothetical protein